MSPARDLRFPRRFSWMWRHLICDMLFYREDRDTSCVRKVVNIYQTAHFLITEDNNIQMLLPFIIRKRIVKMSTELFLRFHPPLTQYSSYNT
jgi:hypothetical protein